jgi:hypothetical protein
MINSETGPLSSCLVYEDMLPLAWLVMGEEARAINVARAAEHNEHVLRCVNLLSDKVKEKIDDESEVDSTLVRLEAKMNLILEMLSKLSVGRDDLGKSTQVRVAATGIEWICREQQPTEGDKLWIKLNIDSRVPEALQLAAQVETISDTDSGVVIYAKFDDMGEAVQDQLEKMIFRQHRRKVAHSKSEQTSVN